ncbi:uncharacterized protein LOC132641978 isoform X1 [Lycium barbarum]|uniref:uncharacterized protein LOC132641978 isoform X1 n=1 Tax=Lycium barbarum TaxID=112863 RepID=UPI00293EFB70|nr:uncharacterized protein LOC132641978 isoform X1 [Lycium barbarum]
MGQNTGASGKSKKVEEEMKKEILEEEEEEVEEHDEQDGMSVHSPCKPQSSALRKEQSQVELEIRLLEALEIYPPAKLRGIHRHFVLYGLTEYLRRSFNRQFAPDDVLKLLDRFYNLDMVKPDDEDAEILNQEEEFCLPQSYFSKEES